jgi:hypothetical protein
MAFYLTPGKPIVAKIAKSLGLPGPVDDDLKTYIEYVYRMIDIHNNNGEPELGINIVLYVLVAIAGVSYVVYELYRRKHV